MTGEPNVDGASPTYGDFMDHELVRRAAEGETRAFDELMRRYRDRVYRLALNMLWNEHEADDVAQEVFVRAYCNLKKFRGDSSFFTWLYRIAVNVVYTQSKKAGRRREIHQLAQQVKDEQAKPAPSPEQTAEHEDLMRWVYLGLQHLDPRLREVLVLRDIEGLDIATVSDILKIPSGTVKSRLFRAQDDLRQWMQAQQFARKEGQS